MTDPHRGFTLIELLIVVAIIAILAAIAVPNFLEAQTRSKSSRVQADMRSIATALEAYRVDYNAYPLAAPHGSFIAFKARLVPLTTPVAFMTSIPDDIFRYRARPTDPSFDYLDRASTGNIPVVQPVWNPFPGHPDVESKQWCLQSMGPDQRESLLLGTICVTYDPTNGTVSNGDIHRYGP